jgi:glycerol-3-phosphate dehydrogenase
MPAPSNEHPILILGAGINGAAAARELALCGLPVVVVDKNDLAFGATGYSSRLIHGGLRYLEYREFGLVRESLSERARLLETAPHLVRPLRLFIPAKSRFGGLLQSAGKFLGLPLGGKSPQPRGSELVRMGLLFYDLLSWGSLTGGLAPRSAHDREDPVAPHLQPSAGSYLLSYSDAQISFPERMVVELLLDAQALAAERGNRFELHTYTVARLEGAEAVLRSQKSETTLTPSLIINATGAWVDETLARLPASSSRLMGGTKGSHFLTWNRDLVAALGGQAIYAEAADGRPVFVLPFGEGTLVGTTDLPYQGNPADAVATEEELGYLLNLVNGWWPALSSPGPILPPTTAACGRCPMLRRTPRLESLGGINWFGISRPPCR